MERKLKVLHICANGGGGAGFCCLRIHKALLKQGVDSKVLTLNKYSKDVPEVYQFGRINKYGTLEALIRKAINKLILKCGLTLTDRNRAVRMGEKTKVVTSLPISYFDVAEHPLVKEADIIHLHWINNFVDYPSFFKKVKKPIVWTLHDENLFYGIFHYNPGEFVNDSFEKKFYDIKKEAIANAEKLGIVFLSKMMHDEFSENRMIKGRPNTVINNPVDCDQFKPVDKKIARRKFDIANDKIVFSFVAGGISDPRKGLGILSETLQRMNIPDAYILAVGNKDGYESNSLVHAVGPVYDSNTMSEAYSCADYFVMPSLKEAFAQTPIESMACGIPAIVFPVSGTEELITSENGVRAKGFTSLDLEEAIRLAMATKYDATTIRQDMISRFSPEIIAKKYIAFYERMLQS